ncbi:hypothetical protein MJN69_31340, partial [Salmonella enterica subsp. enterica serovar Kentucky]|nr:hypothetical protein [Salmonella enterica subsp. enterica serovar Kentucky]
FFRCLNGSRRISLTDLRFFAPALTKEEFHGNRLLWLAAVDKLVVARARKIQRFLSQPFFVAEVFTGSPGKYVSLKDTIRGF